MTIASEITRLQGAKADLKTSIEAKGVTVPSSATIDTYSGYVDQIQTSSSIVNGVIENFLAENGVVDADTFVEIVTESGAKAGGENDKRSYGAKVDITGDGRAICVYSYDTSLKCFIVDFSGDTPIATTPETLMTISSSYRVQALRYMSNGKLLLCYGPTVNDPKLVCVLTISGDTVTAGTPVSTAYNSKGNSTTIERIEDDKAILTGFYGSGYPYAVVVTLVGNSVSIGTQVQVYNGTDLSVVHSTMLDSNRQFTTLDPSSPPGQSSKTPLRSVILTKTSNDSITVGSLLTVYPSSRSTTAPALTHVATTEVIAINSAMVAVFYTGNPVDSSNYPFLWGAIFNVNGSSIAAPESYTQLTASLFTFSENNAVKVADGLIAILCGMGSSSSTSQRATLMTVRVAGDGLLRNSSLFLETSGDASNGCGLVKIGDYIGTVYDYSDSTYPLRYRKIPLKIKPSESAIDGLTKTECTTSTAGEVWVLNS